MWCVKSVVNYSDNFVPIFSSKNLKLRNEKNKLFDGLSRVYKCINYIMINCHYYNYIYKWLIFDYFDFVSE